MVVSFFRKLASQVKAKRKHQQLWAVWARPGLESLDQRILPSVTAMLDPTTGILSVMADQTGGTTQVEIVQTPNNTQITIGDTGSTVNTFNLSDVQQIQFQYASFPAITIPVNGSQMTLTGFNIAEADLNLGDSSLSAAVNATLPDGTALSVAGSIDNQGNYDLTGTADITVDGFGLPATQFELTNSSLAAAATLTVGSDSVSVAGSLDNQGNYDLTGTGSVTVGTFSLPAVSFELTNTSLAASATLAVGNDSVSLAGSVDSQGNYDLTGTADITVAGLAISGASFELTNTSLTAMGTVSLGSDSVSLAGSVDSQGNYDLTGNADITVDGFAISGTSFELTNTSLTAMGTISVGSDSVSLSGTVDNQGDYDLTGTGTVTVDGFGINASFELTNTSLTATGSISLGSDSVSLAGTVDSQGNYDLTGTSAITVAGFGINASFELTNTSLTATGAVSLGSDSVNLAGTVDSQGNYDLTGTSTITVAGFGINASFELTNTSLTATGSISVGGANVNVQGTVDSQGNYDLSGTADITVAGFPIAAAAFHLTNTNLTAAGAIVVGSDHIALAGSVDSQGNYDLTGNASITVAGFAITASFELTNTNLTAAGSITVGSDHVNLVGTADNMGNYHLLGTAQITVAGFAISAAFTLTNTSLAATGTVTLGSDHVTLTGTVNNQGNYNLTGTAQITVAGFGINASFTLTNTNLTVSGTVNIPNIGNLTFTGTVTSAGQYTLTATTQLTVSGLSINASLTLNNTNLTIAATVNLPLVGNVNLSGTVNSQGQFSMTANVANINILFVTLTSASVTVTNSSVLLNASASGIPLLGTVNFTGTVSGGSWTFTATLPSVSIAGFTLTNVMATLDNTSFRVAAHATGIPLVGTLDFSGTISATGFSLSAAATNVDVLGFIHFASISLTLSNNPLGLSLSAATSLPVVGNVTFTGMIDPSGNFTISATAPSFTLLGFLTFNNATVSLRIGTNASLTVSAGIDLLNIGHVTFSGTITAGGHYSFTASASLTVAGFNLGTGNLSISDAPANVINIGPFTTAPLPLVGAVTLQGSYGAGGMFSFQITLHPTPPIMIGPIPVDTIIFGLSNTSLTLGIGIGYDLSSFLHIGGTGVVTVFAPSAQHDFGDFDLVTTVDVTLVGFQAAGVRMELKNTKGQFSFTIDGNIALLITNVNVHGEIDFNKGLVGFAGSANITVAGFGLSNSNFLITNAQVQFVNGMWTFPHDAQGHLIPGSGIHIEVHSHTALNVGTVLNATVDFDGSFQKSGSSYAISVTGRANLTVAGFNLANASLTIDNTHMAVAVHFVYSGVFTVDFAGSLTSTGTFDVSGSAALGLAGFASVANASFHLTNTSLTISAQMNLKVANVNLNGTFQSNGNFSLTGSASVSFAGFGAVTGSFTLNNSGASVQATVNVLVAQVAFSGSIQSNGNFSLAGSANVGLAGFPVASASFTLTNGGATFRVTVNVQVASVAFSGSVDIHGNYSLTGTANVNLAGFPVATASFTLNNSGVRFSASINVFVATVSFSGSVATNGTFSLTGTANVNLAGFGTTSASFTINNSGVSFSTTINVHVATVNFSGTVATNGNFRVTGSASVGFAGFGGSGSFTLTNSGLTVSATVNVVVATINVSGSVSTSGAFSFTVSTNMSFAGIGGSGSLTLNNSGVTVNASLGISPLGVHIAFSGAVNSNGTFRFTLHAGLGWSSLGASVDFTLTNGGFSAVLHAGFDLTASVSAGPWTLRVGFRGSVDVSFSIATNGTFSATGSLQACAYLGIGGCVGIGFRLSTHQFCILTSQIGFSIWGVGFHPFGDICANF